MPLYTHIAVDYNLKGGSCQAILTRPLWITGEFYGKIPQKLLISERKFVNITGIVRHFVHGYPQKPVDNPLGFTRNFCRILRRLFEVIHSCA